MLFHMDNPVSVLTDGFSTEKYLTVSGPFLVAMAFVGCQQPGSHDVALHNATATTLLGVSTSQTSTAPLQAGGAGEEDLEGQISVRHLLAAPEFGMRLLAGVDRIDEAVRWAHPY